MNHNTFLHTALNPFVNTLKHHFKNDELIIKKLTKMHKDEIIKLSKIKPTNNVNAKYLEIIHKFIKFKNNSLHNQDIALLKSELNNNNNTLYNPHKNSKQNKSIKNKSKKNVSNTNVHKLLQKNWNNMLK
jgi:hypothetical protein